MNKSIIVIILIVLAGGIIYFMQSSGPGYGTLPAMDEAMEKAPLTQEPPVTGNVDDAVEAILQDSASDEVPVAESDPSLTAEDNAALDGFGQAFGASSF